MKKIIFIIILSLYVSVNYGQQTLNLLTGVYTDSIENTIPTRDFEEVEDGIIVTYHFSKAIVQSDPLYIGASFVKINGFGLNPRVGEPSTLFRQDTYVVPNGAKVRISFIDSAYVDYPITMAPARPYLLNRDTIGYTLDNVKPISNYTGFYPLNTIGNLQFCDYNGINLLTIPLYPVKYRTSDNTTRFFTTIKYKISYDKELLSRQIDVPKMRVYDNVLSNIALNYSPRSTTRSEAGLAHELDDIATDYVIITTPEYVSAANRLAEWKRVMGYRVRIETSDSWIPQTIKQSIQSNYTHHVLLLGDYQDVPSEYKTNLQPHFTDYYYSIPYNYNNIYFQGKTLGRLSVSSLAEAKVVIDKIINYEKNPNLDSNFYKTGLNCAYFESEKNGSTYTGYDTRRFVLTSEDVRNCLVRNHGKNVNRVYISEGNITPQYWENGTYSYGEPVPDSVRSLPWNGNSSQIINNINDGAFYVLHRDHGDRDKWCNPQFTMQSIDSLQNGNKLPVVFSINCFTGEFATYTSICFAEKFLRKENGGCVAIYAATEESFSGFNDALTLCMFHTIFPDDMLIPSFPDTNSNVSYPTPSYDLGTILSLGMRKMDETLPVGDNDTRLYTHELFHLFGDPTMEIYTDTPTPFETPPTIIRGVDTLKVIVNSTEKTKLTFYNKTNGDIASFDEKEVDYVYSQFGQNTDSIIVCVTAHNKIPYIDGISEDIYIQNEDVYGPITYKGNKIRVGSNVTNAKPTGPVTFESGKVSIIGKDVEIHGETTIPLGTEFEIKTE